MANNSYINLNRLEFVVTKACSGRCRHCSLGELTDKGSGIDTDSAVLTVKRLTENFQIESIL